MILKSLQDFKSSAKEGLWALISLEYVMLEKRKRGKGGKAKILSMLVIFCSQKACSVEVLDVKMRDLHTSDITLMPGSLYQGEKVKLLLFNENSVLLSQKWWCYVSPCDASFHCHALPGTDVLEDSVFSLTCNENGTILTCRCRERVADQQLPSQHAVRAVL